jgi:hypothetical protein
MFGEFGKDVTVCPDMGRKSVDGALTRKQRFFSGVAG